MTEVAFMAALIVWTVLGAFGLLCALWVLFGFLLPGGRGAAMVFLYRGEPGEEVVLRRYLWLYNTGLIRSPPLLVDCGLSPKDRKFLEQHPIILCTAQELHDKLEQERAHLGTAGT
jgi:hypothetical protein